MSRIQGPSTFRAPSSRTFLVLGLKTNLMVLRGRRSIFLRAAEYGSSMKEARKKTNTIKRRRHAERKGNAIPHGKKA